MSQILEGHIVQRYDGDLNALHTRVLEMGGLVLNQARLALRAFSQADLMAASEVLEREHTVDELEIQSDEDIIHTIAKRQPVASDLRIIMSFSKAIIDLERVGDEAARVAGISKNLYDTETSHPSSHLMHDVTVMGKLAIDKLQEALNCFDTLSLENAMTLAAGRDEMDAEFQASLRHLATFLFEDARNVGHTIQIVLAIKALERIGDHARNLAEYVVYMLSGKDIRHANGTTPTEPLSA